MGTTVTSAGHSTGIPVYTSPNTGIGPLKFGTTVTTAPNTGIGPLKGHCASYDEQEILKKLGIITNRSKIQ